MAVFTVFAPDVGFSDVKVVRFVDIILLYVWH